MRKIYELIIKLIGREMFMYLVFGVLTTLVNFIVYYICNIILTMSAGLSTTIAYIISIIFAYITNKIWVFNSVTNTKKETFNEFIKFISARIFTYFVDLVLIIILVDKMHFNSLLMKILVNILVIILNYIASKLVIFKKR